MEYVLVFTEQAEKDISFHKKSGNKKILHKIFELIDDTLNHPYEGLGKPEALKYNLSGNWSRRITREHRLVYEVVGNKLVIYSLKGHY